jgi:hypothetical protein
MRRHALGIIALVLLAVGIGTLATSEGALSGTCLRVGGVLAILWLAWPQLQEIPLWLVGVIGVALLVVLRFPKLLWAAVPLAFVLWLLRPRAPRRTSAKSPRD